MAFLREGRRTKKIEKGDVVEVTNGIGSLTWPEGDAGKTPVHWLRQQFLENGPWTVVRKVLDLPSALGWNRSIRNDTVIENEVGAVTYVREKFLRQIPPILSQYDKERKMMIDPMLLPPGALIQFHHELWMWCPDNPEKDKEDWPRLSINGGDVQLGEPYCFACIAQYQETGTERVPEAPANCDHCLVDFPKDGKCLGGLYQMWVNLGGEQRERESHYSYRERMAERSEVARTIACLPMRIQKKKEPPVAELKMSMQDSITNEYSRAIVEETDEGRKIYGDWTDAKLPRRYASPWSDGEDNLLVKGFYTMTEAIALTHQRNPGVVRGRLHKLLREHKI